MGLYDVRPANRLFDIIGRDEALQLHLPSTKSPTHHLVGSKALVFLSEMRNAILNRNQTTWGNTDARLAPRAFYEPAHNREIAIRERGGGRVMISWINYGTCGGLRREKGPKGAILESESLIRWGRMGGNSAGSPEISGALADRIAKTPIYGNQGNRTRVWKSGRWGKR